jgi:uncharacterized protein (TIGR00725 family)
MSNDTITIFGTGRAKEGDSVYKLAYETGRLLAKAGFIIANGGYGGTMLAAAKGASEAGGEVIGVTCSAFKSSEANEYVSRKVVSLYSWARLMWYCLVGPERCSNWRKSGN